MKRWIEEIRKYMEDDYDDNIIIKMALSYTLQSLRHNENLKKYNWGNDE